MFDHRRVLFAVALTALLGTLWAPRTASADSPLTSTDFAVVYQDTSLVARATEHAFDERFAVALIDQKVPHDVRAALINAFGWSVKGQNNAGVLLEYIAKQRGMRAEQLKPTELSAAELFSLGYMRAMDNYLELSPIGGGEGPLQLASPLELLKVAQMKAPKDYTIALIGSLVQAQAAMQDDWCVVFTSVNQTVEGFKGERNLRDEATKIIMEYITLYKSACKTPVPLKGD